MWLNFVHQKYRATHGPVTGCYRIRDILHRRGSQGLPGLSLLVWVEGVHLLPCLMAPDLAGVPPTGCLNFIQPPTNCLSREQAAAPRPRAGWLEQKLWPPPAPYRPAVAPPPCPCGPHHVARDCPHPEPAWSSRHGWL